MIWTREDLNPDNDYQGEPPTTTQFDDNRVKEILEAWAGSNTNMGDSTIVDEPDLKIFMGFYWPDQEPVANMVYLTIWRRV